ncbi:MAG: DUF4160 domain-containing protein [Verrucomicrobiota bacterium]
MQAVPGKAFRLICRIRRRGALARQEMRSLHPKRLSQWRAYAPPRVLRGALACQSGLQTSGYGPFGSVECSAGAPTTARFSTSAEAAEDKEFAKRIKTFCVTPLAPVPQKVLIRFQLYFYAQDGNEPPHIHVAKAGRCQILVVTGRLSVNHGFRPHDLRKVARIIEENEPFIMEKWNEFFRP